MTAPFHPHHVYDVPIPDWLKLIVSRVLILGDGSVQVTYTVPRVVDQIQIDGGANWLAVPALAHREVFVRCRRLPPDTIDAASPTLLMPVGLPGEVIDVPGLPGPDPEEPR